ncbi:voltage-gated potassium channel, partial [Lojkania enalia]
RRKLWKRYSDGPYNWWFASTAIPLVAASLGPLANVLSICALVTSWRETVYIDGQFVGDFDGVLFPDPPWCYWLNVASLITGFLGNVFLLLNFTQRIRYIFALPLTIVFWYLSTGFLIGITACMEIYAPPARPNETYTQGFWYAVIAAVLYLICSMILMVNMLGYFLGHYPDHFALTDAQRTLILQTMLFFIWLAGGGAIFSRIESDAGETGWAFPDALYFCDVTILTVGFGDLYPTTDVGRGLVFPYSVGGIIMLGLVISAIYKFMRQIGEENIEEKDRFDTMRRLQRSTDKFKRWYALTFSVCAFSILWCVGAVVFWQCEKDAQGMTYFQALYFCYVSLLTIGYGDLAPKSNPGRCFFVVWSLIAVPTMTILISDMGDTVIEKFKTWSNQLADFTILPKEGIWRMFLDKHPWLLNWLQSWHDRRAAKKRLKRGFATMNPEEGQAEDEGTPTPAALSRRLALCIRRVAADLRLPKPRKYDYEDWVEFTRLIKFSKMLPGSSDGTTTQDEDEDELIDWDWLGENSPLMSGLGESEWLLERLTESLVRLERRR